jgi:hypothetical protein
VETPIMLFISACTLNKVKMPFLIFLATNGCHRKVCEMDCLVTIITINQLIFFITGDGCIKDINALILVCTVIYISQHRPRLLLLAAGGTILVLNSSTLQVVHLHHLFKDVQVLKESLNLSNIAVEMLFQGKITACIGFISCKTSRTAHGAQVAYDT